MPLHRHCLIVEFRKKQMLNQRKNLSYRSVGKGEDFSYFAFPVS